MTKADRVAGIQPWAVVRLATSSARRHALRGVVTLLVVGVAAGAVVGTSGRTDIARRNILSRLEDPSARLIRVVLGDDAAAGVRARDALARIGGLSSVQWSIGLSKAGPVGRNLALGSSRTGNASKAVGTLVYSGDLLGGPLVSSIHGRTPKEGEALVGRRAAAALGLADAAGTVDDEALGPVAVIGEVAALAPVDNLDAYVLVRGTAATPLAELLVLARRSEQVEPLAALLPTLLGPASRPPAIERARELLALRASLAEQIGNLDGAVLLASLLSSLIIVGVIMYGAVQDRRREFGLRRSQGATRSTIGVLVLLESGGLAALGALVGAGTAAGLVAYQAGSAPDPCLTLAAGTLVALTAALGSVPPAILAAYREPLYVLRAA